jgi:hypothetical protein
MRTVHVVCSLIFAALRIGERDLASCLATLKTSMGGHNLPDLKQIILLRSDGGSPGQFQPYESFLSQESSIRTILTLDRKHEGYMLQRMY